ncbi:signal peptidase I [Bacillus sp. DJP31]|uniref:signal peptidase I n=1 Tax=Bacillus sp. DJP31 TaxID=3409789 RepID=UPI003BB5E12B
MLITHRIVDVVNSNSDQVIYRTKGDNNDGEDPNPVLSQNVVAQYTGFTIPRAGYFLSIINSNNGAFIFIIPGLLLLGYSCFTIMRTIAQIEGKNASNAANKNV